MNCSNCEIPVLRAMSCSIAFIGGGGLTFTSTIDFPQLQHRVNTIKITNKNGIDANAILTKPLHKIQKLKRSINSVLNNTSVA